MHVLDTERLTLRWLEPTDAAFMFELMNDPDWLQYIGDRGIRSPEDARRHIVEGPRALCERLGFGLMLVELRESGVPIGACGLLKRDWLEDVDIGFAFLPAYRGHGYAHEAAAAMVHHGRTSLGLHRVAAIVSDGNASSRRLLDRLGFRFERMVVAPGATTPICLYATAAATP